MIVTHLNFSSEFLQTLLVYFEVPLGHVAGLLGVEGVGDAPQHEHVELDPLLAVLLVLLLLLLKTQICKNIADPCKIFGPLIKLSNVHWSQTCCGVAATFSVCTVRA